MSLFLLLSQFPAEASYIHPIFLPNSTYDSRLSPFDVSGQPYTLYLEPTLLVLVGVEESTQVVSYLIFLNYTWQDPRLAYDSNEIRIPYAVIPSDIIWLPWINCWNCVEVKKFDRNKDMEDAVIQPDGSVMTAFRARLDTVCLCDVSAFPFDTQYCTINFDAGFGLDDRQIIVPLFNISADAPIGTPEWSISFYDLQIFNFTTFKSFYKLKRNPQFYLYFMILPTLVITLACMATLLLPSRLAEGEKGPSVSLGITGLLGLTFLLSIIVQEVPRSKKLPLIGKWLLIEMFFMVLAMVTISPVKRIKKRVSGKNHWIGHGIDIALFVVIFGANVVTSLFLMLFPDALTEPIAKNSPF